MLAVLLFHADFAVFSGGFVGVDVFFVISGYLITAIIRQELEGDGFSIIAFYERRVRRILPALFVTLLVSTVIAAFVLLPNELRNFGQSVTATTLFASNILFWREAGYFDGPADLKPLLHTWSLAVEEQFYIIFPLVVLALCRARRNYRLFTLAALLVSLVLAMWSVSYAPSAAFYLAPLRCWELLLGALLAMGAVPLPTLQITRDGLSLLGVGLIGYGIVGFSPTTPFPGASALVPCLGAVLVIHAGVGGQSLAGRVLGTPPLVLMGLVSYSLYLWHWPLLVLTRSHLGRALSTPETLVVLAAAVIIAFGSWRWVERPFRRRPVILSRPRLFTVTGVVMGAFAALGVGLHLTDGLPSRLPPEALRVLADADRTPDRSRCVYPSTDAVRDRLLCPMGVGGRVPPTFVLWGDSHAEMLKTAIGEAAARSGRSGLFAGYPGCPPLVGISFRDPSRTGPQRCSEFNRAVLDLASSDGIDTAILVGHWSLYATGTRYGRDVSRAIELIEGQTTTTSVEPNEILLRRSMERTIAALVQAGKKVVIVGPMPEVAASVPQALARAAWRGQDLDIRPARDSFDARNQAVLSLLTEVSGPSVTVVYPHEALCDESACSVASDGRALYADDNHLSLYGADSIRYLFEGLL